MSSITSNLDWMLTRDITGRRKCLRLGAALLRTAESGTVDVDAPLRPVDKGGMGVLSGMSSAGRRLSGESWSHRHSGKIATCR
jgi:hypothetical protein